MKAVRATTTQDNAFICLFAFLFVIRCASQNAKKHNRTQKHVITYGSVAVRIHRNCAWKAATAHNEENESKSVRETRMKGRIVGKLRDNYSKESHREMNPFVDAVHYFPFFEFKDENEKIVRITQSTPPFTHTRWRYFPNEKKLAIQTVRMATQTVEQLDGGHRAGKLE